MYTKTDSKTVFCAKDREITLRPSDAFADVFKMEEPHKKKIASFVEQDRLW